MSNGILIPIDISIVLKYTLIRMINNPPGEIRPPEPNSDNLSSPYRLVYDQLDPSIGPVARRQIAAYFVADRIFIPPPGVRSDPRKIPQYLGDIVTMVSGGKEICVDPAMERIRHQMDERSVMFRHASQRAITEIGGPPVIKALAHQIETGDTIQDPDVAATINKKPTWGQDKTTEYDKKVKEALVFAIVNGNLEATVDNLTATYAIELGPGYIDSPVNQIGIRAVADLLKTGIGTFQKTPQAVK